MISVSTGFTAYNAPWDDLAGELVKLVKSTQESLHILIFGYHLPVLTEAIIDVFQRQKETSVILDHSQAEGRAEQSEVDKLVAAGVPVLIGTSPVHHAILHTKQVIVDGRWVEDGSYNYSLSAGQQANTMHVIDSRDYAAAQIAEHKFLIKWIRLHEMLYQPQGATLVTDISDPIPSAPTPPASFPNPLTLTARS